jgi:hypothetical protein
MTLTALYEWFAQDCTQAAGQTEDPKKREMLLKLAEQWLLDARRSAAEGSSMLPTTRSTAFGVRP